MMGTGTPNFSRQSAMRGTARRDIHLAVPCTKDRDRQMRRGAKTEETYAVAAFNTGHAQAAEANDSSAE